MNALKISSQDRRTDHFIRDFAFCTKLSSAIWKITYTRKLVQISYSNYFLPKVLRCSVKLTSFFLNQWQLTQNIHLVFYLTLQWLSICYNWQEVSIDNKISVKTNVCHCMLKKIPIQISFVKISFQYEWGVVQDTKMGKTFYFSSRNLVRNEEYLQMGLLGKICFSLQNKLFSKSTSLCSP